MYVHIENWCNRPLQSGCYPYGYVNGIYLRHNRGGKLKNVAILVAILAVNKDDYREALDAAKSIKEDKAGWISFFHSSIVLSGWRENQSWRHVPLYVGSHKRSVF